MKTRKQHLYVPAMFGGVSYELRDDFSIDVAAGNVDATDSAPGPGTRVAQDTNNKISISSGLLDFATGEANNDGIWIDAVARAAGRIVIAEITFANTTGSPGFGVDTNQVTSIRDRFYFANAGVLKIQADGATAITVGDYTAASHHMAVIMRASGLYWLLKGGNYSDWTIVWISTAGSAAGYPGIQSIGTAGVFTCDFLRVPFASFLPTPIAYDTFTRDNGAIGESETSGPDGQTVPAITWNGSTWTIDTNCAVNTLVSFGADDISNGAMESGDPPDDWVADGATLASVADERTGGSGSASLSCSNAGAARSYADQTLDLPDGTWIKLELYSKKIDGNCFWAITKSDDSLLNSSGGTGLTWTKRRLTTRLVGANCKVRLGVNSVVAGQEARFDDVSVKALDLSEMMATFEAGTPSVIATVAITNDSFGSTGLALCVDDAQNPQNLITAVIEGSDVYVDKCVGGTWTRLIETAITYGAAKELRIITWRDGSDLKLLAYYDDIQEGSEQTISDAGIVDNTIHGMIATDADTPTQINNFCLFARGEDGEYNQLARYTR
jgi:hypothetical protein